MSEIHIIQLLFAIHKYNSYQHKLRQSKADASKSTFTTNPKDRSKASITTQQLNNDQNKNSLNPKNVAIKEQKESIDELTESVYSQETETTKDEDFLSMIANKLLDIINSNISPNSTDHDVIIDSILMLWGKCKEVFQKSQTGSEETYRWVIFFEITI